MTIGLMLRVLSITSLIVLAIALLFCKMFKSKVDLSGIYSIPPIFLSIVCILIIMKVK